MKAEAELQKQVVLLTGTSNGLGRATAEKLAREGYRVIASMRGMAGKNVAASRALKTLAAEESLDLEVIELDVSDDESVQQAVKRVIAQSGRIDAVVNNAGVVTYGAIESFTPEEMQEHFDVNVFGQVRVNRAVLPQMRAQGSGLLIYISSGLGRVVFPTMGVYCAGKFAAEAMSETMRYELAEFGVDSVIIEPGVYPTNINKIAGRSKDRERNAAYGKIGAMADQLPKQFGEGFDDAAHSPMKIADAVLHLIDTPQGSRPLRTLVGVETEAMSPLNETAAEIQAGVLSAFGVPELAPLSR